MTQITASNYFEVFPKLNFKSAPKNVQSLIKNSDELLREANVQKSTDREVQNEIAAYIRNLNTWIKNGIVTIKIEAKPTASKTAKRTASKPKPEAKVVKMPKPKATAKPKATPKPKPAAKPKVTQEAKDKAKLDKLKKELARVETQVKKNAKFKDKIAVELTKYLKKNNLSQSVGLAGIPDEISRIQNRLKFYKGLLSGDNKDFKVIGQRLGIIYRTAPIRKKK